MKKNHVIIGLSIILGLAVAWWLVSPLFIDKVVDEQLPESIEEMKKEMFSGAFIDADSFHKTSGTAKIIEIEGKKYLSLENFETTNGPDLFVYLSKDKEASEFINLGKLKGNIGNQNYEILEEINLDDYNEVLIWCRAFKVLFGSAELN
jgi:hypothetical protein